MTSPTDCEPGLFSRRQADLLSRGREEPGSELLAAIEAVLNG
jgi:hypothetical protein